MSSYYRVLAAAQYSPELQAIINYANSQGFSLPDTPTLVYTDIFIKQLIADGIWSKLDLFYNCGYNDTSLADFSRINWKDPSNFLMSINDIGSRSFYSFGGWFTNAGGANTNQMTINTGYQQASDNINGTSTSKTLFGRYDITFAGTTLASPSDGDTYGNNGFFAFSDGTDYIRIFNGGSPLSFINYSFSFDTTQTYIYEDGVLVSTLGYTPVALSTNDFKMMGVYEQTIGAVSTHYSVQSRIGQYGIAGFFDATDTSNYYNAYDTFKTNIGL